MKPISFVQSFFILFFPRARFASIGSKRRGFGVGVLFLLLLTVCVASGDTKAKPEATFKVASYNINYGNVDLKTIVATIRKADPDIVALQETNRQSEAYLKRKLGKLYPHMRFRHAPLAGGFGFLSKVPFRRVSYMKPCKGPFGTYLVEVKFFGKVVEIANLHLCPTVPRKKDTLITFLKRVLKTQMQRIKEILSIYPQLSKKLPRLVVGDFNSPVGTYVPMFLEGKGMIDSYKSVTPESEQAETWCWKINNFDLKLRIDYIFHSQIFKTLSSTIFRSDASDHYLICSTLTLSPEAEKKDEKKDGKKKSAAEKAKKPKKSKKTG